MLPIVVLVNLFRDGRLNSIKISDKKAIFPSVQHRQFFVQLCFSKGVFLGFLLLEVSQQPQGSLCLDKRYPVKRTWCDLSLP